MKQLEGIMPIKDLSLFHTSKGALALLWAIRENGPISITKLCEIVFGLDIEMPLIGRVDFSKSWTRQTHLFIDAVLLLIQLDLVETLGFTKEQILGMKTRTEVFDRFSQIILSASPKLASLQTLLDVSLTELLGRTEDSLRVTPLFGRPSPLSTGEQANVFVIMPFDNDLRSVYSDFILPIVSKLELSCKRGDLYFSSRAIMAEIWSALYSADVCIADCTGKNANVFYELGIAHTLGKPSILIAQSIDDIPFDIRHLRTILYSMTSSGIQEFQDSLESTLLMFSLTAKPPSQS